MKLVKPSSNAQCAEEFPVRIDPAVSPADRALFNAVVSTRLEDWQIEQIVSPERTYHRQENVLAVHWHPEFVPLDMIRRRLDRLYPNSVSELIIPTQHNIFTTWGEYVGVEVDCYASRFDQKVQFLVHFAKSRLPKAGVLSEMLAHTFKYRSSQLFEYMHSIIEPDSSRRDAACRETGADGRLVGFVQAHVRKIQTLIEENGNDISPEAIKNKLLRNYFDAFRPELGDTAVNRVQAFLKAVKMHVKQDFTLTYFYRASEIIEEVRGFGGCIVIPHPEQFWPILLAGYDVDGYEVWNPQSQRYTDFLISAVQDMNARRPASSPRLLVFMGDDTHMGEKTKRREQQDEEKTSREVGLQPAWDDLSVRKKLIAAGIGRRKVIEEYRQRLSR